MEKFRIIHAELFMSLETIRRFGFFNSKLTLVLYTIDGTGTGNRPFRSGPVPVWISDRPVYCSTGRLSFEQPFIV